MNFLVTIYKFTLPNVNKFRVVNKPYPFLIKGSSRYVFLLFGLAFKFPSLNSYRNFLWGLIANLNEHKLYYTLKHKKLCPIVFHIPLGILNVMPMVKLMSEDEFNNFKPIEFCCLGEGKTIPAEAKRDSFGWYKGRIVVIDYG